MEKFKAGVTLPSVLPFPETPACPICSSPSRVQRIPGMTLSVGSDPMPDSFFVTCDGKAHCFQTARCSSPEEAIEYWWFIVKRIRGGEHADVLADALQDIQMAYRDGIEMCFCKPHLEHFLGHPCPDCKATSALTKWKESQQ